jgi:hypothetical protein
MPKKMRRGALRSALSERLREGNLIIIDEFGFATPKTKDFLGAIGTLSLGDGKKVVKTLIIDSLDNLNLILSSRNVEKTKVTNSFGLNIYDIIYHEKLLISRSALEELSALLDPKREGSRAEEAAVVEAPPVEEKPKAKKAAKPKSAKAEKDTPTADDDAVDNETSAATAEEASASEAENIEAAGEEASVEETAKEATDNE